MRIQGQGKSHAFHAGDLIHRVATTIPMDYLDDHTCSVFGPTVPPFSHISLPFENQPTVLSTFWTKWLGKNFTTYSGMIAHPGSSLPRG